MDLKAVHEGIKPHKRKKRVGRGPGSKRGRTATRGNKGQYARSGDDPKLLKEGGQMPLFRRLAKRGFNNPFKPIRAVVNIVDLSSFPDGVVVDLEAFRKTGLAKGRFERLKILGEGELNVKLEVHAHEFSESAREKIEKAGGLCVVIALRHSGPKVRNKMRPRAPKEPIG